MSRKKLLVTFSVLVFLTIGQMIAGSQNLHAFPINAPNARTLFGDQTEMQKMMKQKGNGRNEGYGRHDG